MKQVEDGLRPCPISDPEDDLHDPEVHPAGIVMCEIERDGDHELWECEDYTDDTGIFHEGCGYSFGHRLAEELGGLKITGTADSCQAGVPESVRRRASGSTMEPPQPVSLGMPGVRP